MEFLRPTGRRRHEDAGEPRGVAAKQANRGTQHAMGGRRETRETHGPGRFHISTVHELPGHREVSTKVILDKPTGAQPTKTGRSEYPSS